MDHTEKATAVTAVHTLTGKKQKNEEQVCAQEGELQSIDVSNFSPWSSPSTSPGRLPLSTTGNTPGGECHSMTHTCFSSAHYLAVRTCRTQTLSVIILIPLAIYLDVLTDV